MYLFGINRLTHCTACTKEKEPSVGLGKSTLRNRSSMKLFTFPLLHLSHYIIKSFMETLSNLPC